ncbi:MAG TPA: hypothetical protein VIG33_14635 [Pseudobdellovibrionaceae bacterium]|jgi:hypothetical protein
MTPAEFNPIYKRLADAYPTQFASQTKAIAIAQEVKGLDSVWFERLVNKIIAANDPFVKLGDLINAERRRLTQEFTTSEQSADFERLRRNSTGMGYESELRKLGANSLWDAVTKAKTKQA